MNKYQEALNTVNAVIHVMSDEHREDVYEPTVGELNDAMAMLSELVDKADAFNEFKCSKHEPELEEYRHTQTLEEYQESKLGKYCANRPLEDILQAVTNIYEENFMFANKDFERVKNNLKEWLDTDAPTERWNEEFETMVTSIYEFKRRKDLFDDFLDSIQWIKNQYEVVKRR